MEKDRSTAIQNPLTAYFKGNFPPQQQPYPGIQADMQPVPDCGEKSYVGSGKLKGRKALVTGGDSGIGRAAAIAYAREGADVAIAYLPAEEKDAQDVKKLIEEAGQKAVLIPGDLKDKHYCTDLVDTAVKQLGGLDIMAMVAGRQIAKKSIEEISDDQLEEVFTINVFSLFRVIKAALPHLSAGATIITTSSIEAYQPNGELLDYASSKGAIKTFSQALAEQLAPKGIRVNSVAPGPIWTALQVSGGQFPDKLPEFGKNTYLKRAGEPAELAGIYVYLASEASSYVTAEVFSVNGGLHT